MLEPFGYKVTYDGSNGNIMIYEPGVTPPVVDIPSVVPPVSPDLNAGMGKFNTGVPIMIPANECETKTHTHIGGDGNPWKATFTGLEFDKLPSNYKKSMTGSELMKINPKMTLLVEDASSYVIPKNTVLTNKQKDGDFAYTLELKSFGDNYYRFKVQTQIGSQVHLQGLSGYAYFNDGSYAEVLDNDVLFPDGKSLKDLEVIVITDATTGNGYVVFYK
ncbi:MAG: hypothetical protein ACRDA4_10035 [Filifactoraceae bacterium]